MTLQSGTDGLVPLQQCIIVKYFAISIINLVLSTVEEGVSNTCI